MASGFHARNVLHDEITGSKGGDQPEKVKDQLIPRVVDQALSHRRKPLAWWASDNHVHFAVKNPRVCMTVAGGTTSSRDAKLLRTKACHVRANRLTK
jgi:hypothetical protein